VGHAKRSSGNWPYLKDAGEALGAVEDEFCVEDDFSGAIRAVTDVIFGARLLGRLIS